MKRLAKVLALVLLVVISFAIVKTILNPAVTSQAAGEVKQIAVIGPTCGPNDPNNPVDASELPDINVKLRGFKPSEKNIKTDVVDYTGQFGFDVDPRAPNVIDIFPGGQYHPIIGSFVVGNWDGTDFESDPWENAVAFETTPQDDIVVPGSGYDIGEGYEVMVLFADHNSIAIKYTREDNVISGYTIHILGINVEDNIIEAYNTSLKNGRKTLPALKAGDLLGHPIGKALLVEFRDTGAFLDPRSCIDIWDGDCDQHPTQQPKVKMAEAMRFFEDNDLNLRSAPRAERQPQCDITYLSKYPKYPPLGSLQACPPEFPTIGQIQNTLPPLSPTGKYCVDPYPEPEGCKNPNLIDNDRKKVDYCDEGPVDGAEVDGYLRICYPDSKTEYDKNNTSQFACGSREPSDTPTYGLLIKEFCEGTHNGTPHQPTDSEGNPNPSYVIWQGVQRCAQGQDPGNGLLGSDRHIMRICMGYFESKKQTIKETPPTVQNQKMLPVCVPTKSSNGRCTSACGTPLSINENNIGFSVKGDCATGQCRASIKLKDNTPLFLPFAADLANYFTGTFDMGAVAEGFISKEKLLEIRKEVSEGNTDSVNEMFAKVGVAKKLLPREVQDQLKCQFITYVKDKVNKFADQATAENTKYIYRDQGSRIVEFKINDIPVSQIQMPPFIETNNCAYKYQGVSIEETQDWLNSPSGEAWIDVPLFDNEESQGKIEFVSGGVFTSELNPIQTSIPEIRRLYNVTRVLQKALSPIVPIDEITSDNPTRYPLISDLNPEKLGLTIGPEITPGENLLVCRKNTPTLEEIYGSEKGYKLEKDTTNYTLGVDCIQQNTKTGQSNSEVCTVGPEGQLNCFQQVAANPPPATKTFENVKVQTRNVTPYLYDTFLQTIQEAGGFLRIFIPETQDVELAKAFEASYSGFPAESNPIEYEITASTNVTLNPSENGWKLLFDKLGGVWTAREFVLKVLDITPAGTGGVPVQTPQN